MHLPDHTPFGQTLEIRIQPAEMYFQRGGPITPAHETYLIYAFDVFLLEALHHGFGQSRPNGYELRISASANSYRSETKTMLLEAPQQRSAFGRYPLPSRKTVKAVSFLTNALRQKLILDGVVSDIFYCQVTGAPPEISNHDMLRLEAFMDSILALAEKEQP